MEGRSIVCDNGTGFMKVGWGGEPFPESTFPTICGRPLLRYEEQIEGVQLKPLMIGDEAAPLRSMLELSCPVDNGIVRDWDDMKNIWEYAFYKKMGLSSEDIKQTKILLTEAPLNPRKNREEMAEIMFEYFGFSALRVALQAILALFTEGLSSGVVVDCGDGVSHVIPIYEGYVIEHFIKRLNIAGKNITNYLLRLLLIRGYAFNSSADFETIRELKEKLCYVSANIKDDRKLALETTVCDREYTLPDGNIIKVGRERFEAPELIFQPELGGFELNGISDTIYNCIESTPVDTRKGLYKHILLSGGSTMFPGLPTRIEMDLKKKFDEEIKAGKRAESAKAAIFIDDPPRRKYGVFMGGSVAASVMGDKEEFWVTKKDYEEGGTNARDQLHSNMLL